MKMNLKSAELGETRMKLTVLLLLLVLVILLSSINCGLCAGQSQSQRASSYIAQSTSDIIEGRYDDAISKLLNAKNEFEKVDDKERIVDSLNLLAYIYYLKGDYEKAESYANQAYENALTLGYEKGLVDCYINLGFIYMDWEMYDKAEDWANQASKKSKEIKYDRGIADALYCIGEVYVRTREYNKALECFNQSKQISEKINYKIRIIESLFGLGSCYYAKFDYEKCIMYSDQVLEKSKEINYKRGKASALELKGDAYTDLKGDYDKALEYYSQALVITKEIGIKRDKAIVLAEIGAIYFYKKDYQKAKDYCMKSEKISEELGCKASLAMLYGILGFVYEGLSESEKAKDCFNTAERYADEVGDPDASRNCYLGLAMLYHNKGDYNEALKYYERGLGILKGRENRNLEIANFLLIIGQIYEEKEDYDMAIKYYADAMEYYNQSLYRFSKENNKKMVMLSLGGIGYVYEVKGSAYYRKDNNDIALEHYINALEYYNQSFNIYSEIKNERILEMDDKLAIADICNSYGRSDTYIAHILKEYEDYDNATKFYDLSIMWHENALNIYQNITDLIVAEQGVAVSYYNIGMTYYDKNDYSTALKYYKQSLEKYEELKMDREAVEVLFTIGETYYNRGDYENVIQSYKKINEKEIISKEQKAEVNYLMGSAYIEWGQKLSGKEREDKFGLARHYLEASYDLYMGIDPAEKAKEVEEMMGDIPQLQPTPIDWNFIGVVVTVILAVIGGGIGIYLQRRKQRFVSRMLEKIEGTYTKFKMNSVICDRELLKLKNDTFQAYKKRLIDENSFSMLEGRIKKLITRERFGSIPPRFEDMLDQILADGKISKDDFLTFKKMIEESTELNEQVKRELNALIEEWKGKQK